MKRSQAGIPSFDFLVATLIVASGSAAAQVQEDTTSIAAEPAADAVPIEVFRGPKGKNLKPGEYPEAQRRRGNEGWVQVNFMVDPQGRTYEIAVVDSTGDVEFEKAALRAVTNWEFEPASLDGKPIDAGSTGKLTFSLTGGKDGAGTEFVRAYKSLMRAISEKDRARADEQLAKLEVNNLYEDAYASLARFNYYRLWGSEAQQLAALKRAVAEESSAKYLPADMYNAALLAIFPMYVQAHDYTNALVVWDQLQKNAANEQILARWRPAMKEIHALREDGRTYSVTGGIEKGTSWFYRLYKNQFKVIVNEGRLSEVKLRCDKHYVFFRYDPEMVYSIAEKFGYCSLELVGDTGTTFRLVQS